MKDDVMRRLRRLNEEIRSLHLRADILHQDLQKILTQSYRPGNLGKSRKNGRTIQQSH